ncbi:zinc metalloprotease, partial [Tenacibaculum maritimum]
KQAEIVFYEGDFNGRILFKYRLEDCSVIYFKESFNTLLGMETSVVFSAAIQYYKDTFYIKSWQENWKLPSKYKHQVTENLTPRISFIDWIDQEKQIINDTTYNAEVGLKISLSNPNGGKLTLNIKKKDDSKFDDNTQEISLEESVVGDTIFVKNIAIKEHWQDFKNVDFDELLVTAEYNGNIKKSKPLKIVPSPKLIVEFRPFKGWKGQFGFDWIRKNDTSLFGDNKYEDIVSKQYTDSKHTKLEKDSNKYKGYFKKDTKQFEDLKKKYKSFTLPWSKKDKKGKQIPEDYKLPWMSLLNGEEAELNIIATIEEQADYIEFETNNNFTITPNKIDVKGKKGIKYKDSITVKIKCKKEFSNDQTLTIKAFKKGVSNAIEVGKIQVWANDKTKQKEKKVVFVQLKTPPISSKFELASNASSEKTRINNYLKQALISLHKDSDIVTLDLTTDKDFLKFVTKSKTVNYTNKKDKVQLHDFLKAKLKIDFKDKYKDYFKAFYFAEGGGDTGGLSGYSQPGKEYVVVFSSANDQTASHEFLHALNLAHSFANSEASSNAEFTYKYKQTENLLDYSHHIFGHKNDRCSLWYWQWVKANKSIT